MVLTGTTGTAQALGPDDINPTAVGVLRLVIAGPVLLLVAQARQDLYRRSRRLPVRPVAVAAIAMAAYQPLFFGGVHRTGVALGTIMTMGSAPLFAGLLAWTIQNETPDRRWFPATVAAVTGGALLVSGGEDIGVDPVGMVMSLGAGLSYAVFTVATKRVLDDHPPIAVMAVTLTGSALLLTPALAVADLGWVGSARGVAVVAHLGLIATAAAYLLFGFGIARLPVATVTTLSLAEPLTAGLLGMAVLGERLSATAWIGALLVVVGLVVVSVGRAGQVGSSAPGGDGGTPGR
jgi:DME family drug/metabolite transporter